MRKNILNRSFVIAATFMFVLLVASATYLPTADASFDACRDDPILMLSDGSTLTVVVDIGTSVTNVKSVGYAIHTPHGVKLVSVVHTTFSGFTGKEQFSFNDDAKPGEYLTDTVVQTRFNQVSVTATSTLNSRSTSVPGVNAQHLKSTLTR